ncbi:hypothetical protein GJ496_005357 [Pomphorhynchus laevis]|nr:hypothetical protein GJ496_005357 [Pomphorhynchus laevis]
MSSKSSKDETADSRLKKSSKSLLRDQVDVTTESSHHHHISINLPHALAAHVQGIKHHNKSHAATAEATAPTGNQSRDVLKQLYEAEQKSKVIVDNARKRRVENIRMARDDAKSEIERYEIELEDKLQVDTARIENERKTEQARFNEHTNQEISNVSEMVKQNNQKAVEYLLTFVKRC